MQSNTSIPTLILWSEKEVSRHTGFAVRTLQGWRIRGGGPPFVRISPRCIRYRPEDVNAWIQSHLRESTSDEGPESPRGR